MTKPKQHDTPATPVPIRAPQITRATAGRYGSGIYMTVLFVARDDKGNEVHSTRAVDIRRETNSDNSCSIIVKFDSWRDKRAKTDKLMSVKYTVPGQATRESMLCVGDTMNMVLSQLEWTMSTTTKRSLQRSVQRRSDPSFGRWKRHTPHTITHMSAVPSEEQHRVAFGLFSKEEESAIAF